MKLPATLTLDGAAALSDALEAEPSGTIDASALSEFDSSALAVLLQARRRGMQVRGAPAKLVQLAQLYGVDELLGLRHDAA